MAEQALTVARHNGSAAHILNIPNGLTELQLAFADNWLLTRNGTEAARKAGYAGDDNQLAVQASTNLRIAKIREYLNDRLNLHMMSADEVLKRLSKQGRASVADVLNEDGEFDLRHAKKVGNDDLIKKLKIRKTRRIDQSTDEVIEEVTHELELHNAQTALELMGKHHRLFGESLTPETVVNIERVELTVVLNDALADVIDVSPE